MSIVTTQSLTRLYGKRVGVQEMSLSVPEGALFGFLGPNGSGKTTTIRVLLGFLRPTRGKASIFGMDCWRETRRIKAETGYVPGDLRLHSWMNGLDALRIFGRVRRRDMLAPGRDLAAQFDLDLRVKVRSMSRGMRQKLGLILAMAHRPRLLILDEPTSSLDPLMQQRLQSNLRALAAAGHTIFFSSHTLSEVEQLCDRVAIVRDGRLVADEPLAELRRRCQRDVRIVWKDPAQAAQGMPKCLELQDRHGTTWLCALTGSVTDLLTWACAQGVADLAIGEPNLESLFRRYYEERPNHGAGASDS